MNKRTKYFIPGHLWCLPLTLGYALFALVVYRAHSFTFSDGVLSCIGGTFVRSSDGATVTRIWGRPGAQTIGAAQCFASEQQRARKDLHVHENTHIGEAFVAGALGMLVTPVVAALVWHAPFMGLALGGFFGVLGYSLAYGVCFFVLFARGGFKAWEPAYRANPFEVWAYAAEDRYNAASPMERSRMWGDDA